ncbi:MAG: DUF4367 domain-containing protein [Clostridiales bacterium]|nr:DUF4367 domain-containing protein [Clostridiales bacterium]
MENDSTGHFPTNTRNDKEIIKEIVTEKERDADASNKMYGILYEASLADEVTMDTDLIDECVKAIDLIEGREEHLDQEKITAMRQKVDKQYKDWLKVQRQRSLRKLLVQSAAGLILFFFMSSAIAIALGYNPIEVIIDWGKDTFHLSFPNHSNEENFNNLAERKIYGSIGDALHGVAVKPLLPGWVPDGFAFTYAEKFTSLDDTKIVLCYENSAHKNIIFDFEIYETHVSIDTFFEKDDNVVEVYDKNNIPHYIFQNLDQVQAVWVSANIVYNINGDISADEVKKIIDSMNGGT